MFQILLKNTPPERKKDKKKLRPIGEKERGNLENGKRAEQLGRKKKRKENIKKETQERTSHKPRKGDAPIKKETISKLKVPSGVRGRRHKKGRKWDRDPPMLKEGEEGI